MSSVLDGAGSFSHTLYKLCITRRNNLASTGYIRNINCMPVYSAETVVRRDLQACGSKHKNFKLSRLHRHSCLPNSPATVRFSSHNIQRAAGRSATQWKWTGSQSVRNRFQIETEILIVGIQFETPKKILRPRKPDHQSQMVATVFRRSTDSRDGPTGFGNGAETDCGTQVGRDGDTSFKTHNRYCHSLLTWWAALSNYIYFQICMHW